MVVLTAETCWALNEYWIYNQISGIKLVSLYSTIKMMHGPINIRCILHCSKRPWLVRNWLFFLVSANLCLSSFVSLWRLQLVYVLYTFSFCPMQSSVFFQYKHQKFNILCSHSLVASTSRVQQKKQNYCQSAKEDTEICRNNFITSITDDVPQQYVLFCLQTLLCLPIRSVVLAKQSSLVFASLCHAF